MGPEFHLENNSLNNLVIELLFIHVSFKKLDKETLHNHQTPALVLTLFSPPGKLINHKTHHLLLATTEHSLNLIRIFILVYFNTNLLTSFQKPSWSSLSFSKLIRFPKPSELITKGLCFHWSPVKCQQLYFKWGNFIVFYYCPCKHIVMVKANPISLPRVSTFVFILSLSASLPTSAHSSFLHF